MKSIKFPSSSYSILFLISIFLALLSIIIPSGQFNYQTGSSLSPAPIIGTYHSIPKSYLSIIDIFIAPIMGAKAIIDFIILVLVLGIFLEILTALKVFEIIINIMIRYNFNERITVLFFLFVISILSSFTGLRDENIVFLSLLIPVFSYLGLSSLIASLTIVLASIIGVSSSMLNPTIIGIFSSFSGFGMAKGFTIRLILYLTLYILCSILLLSILSKHKIPPIKITNRKNLNVKNYLGTVILLLGLIMFVYCLLNQINIIQTQGTLLCFILLAALMGGLKEEQIISAIKKGAQNLLPITINMSMARGIIYILDESHTKDTLLYWSSCLLKPELNNIIFSLICIGLIFGFYFMINSTSGNASLIFPLIYPLCTVHHIPYSLFIVWFLIATGLAQIFNPSGFLISQIRLDHKLSYKNWLKIVFPVPLLFVFLWFISILYI